MKTPLLLAALLLVAPAAARADTYSTTSSSTTASRAGSDDPNMSGSTKRMFIINATTPGGLTFSGAGTATFNNAVGTSNQFNVGSTTSIGVEASVSATQEFDGLASGVMQMGFGSNLMQTNGTSTAAASTQAASASAHTVATETADRESHAKGWEKAKELTGADEYTTGDYGTFDDYGDWVWNDSHYNKSFDELSAADQNRYETEVFYYDFGFFSSGPPETAQTVWQREQRDYLRFKNSYKTESSRAYDAIYTSTFNDIVTTSSTNQEESTETGKITGTFKTTSNTVTAVGQEDQLDAVVASALTAANSSGDSVGGVSWTSVFNETYKAGYANSIGTSTVQTDSTVEVVGLGAIASVNSDSNSVFTVNLDRLDAFKTINAQENSSATANGAATSTLSTNSFATQNSQRTASAFMQAFAANEDTSTSSSTSSSGG